jgi:hypothetical protein
VVVKRYAPGDVSVETAPGDLILTHRDQPVSKLIAFGQRLRFRGKDRPFAHWSHVAVVVGFHGELVEALGRGVQRSRLTRYTDVEFHYVSVDAALHDRRQMARFAEACVGRSYNWWEIVSLGLTLVVGAKIVVGNPGTLICSALAGEALCRGDYIFSRDPNSQMPADIAKELGLRP